MLFSTRLSYKSSRTAGFIVYNRLRIENTFPKAIQINKKNGLLCGQVQVHYGNPIQPPSPTPTLTNGGMNHRWFERPASAREAAEDGQEGGGRGGGGSSPRKMRTRERDGDQSSCDSGMSTGSSSVGSQLFVHVCNNSAFRVTFGWSELKRDCWLEWAEEWLLVGVSWRVTIGWSEMKSDLWLEWAEEWLLVGVSWRVTFGYSELKSVVSE